MLWLWMKSGNSFEDTLQEQLFKVLKDKECTFCEYHGKSQELLQMLDLNESKVVVPFIQGLLLAQPERLLLENPELLDLLLATYPILRNTLIEYMGTLTSPNVLLFALMERLSFTRKETKVDKLVPVLAVASSETRLFLLERLDLLLDVDLDQTVKSLIQLVDVYWETIESKQRYRMFRLMCKVPIPEEFLSVWRDRGLQLLFHVGNLEEFYPIFNFLILYCKSDEITNQVRLELVLIPSLI